MANGNGATLQTLVGDALRDGVDLARKELALFRAEMASNAASIGKGVAMFAVAGIFAIASLIWLTQALVFGLEILLNSKWLAALIVGGALFVIAVAFIVIGKNLVSSASLSPNRTVASIKRDGEVLSERAVG